LSEIKLSIRSSSLVFEIIDRIRDRRRDLLCIAILVCITLASCLPLLTKYPTPGGDEPGFVDVAINLNTRGVLGTPAYRDLLPGADTHVYWQPPMYFVGLAGWFSMAGTGLVQARTFSLLWAVLIVVLVFVLARQDAPTAASMAAAALLAVSYYLTNRAKVARMDAMCIALTLSALLAYRLARDRTGVGLFATSGAVAGLALLTHPLGIVAIATLAIERVLSLGRAVFVDVRTYVLMSCCGLVAALWLALILQDLDSFRLQMAAQFERKALLGSYWHQFSMARTHVVSVTVVCGAATWLLFTSVRRKEPTSVVAIAFALSFAAATSGRETGYFSYFYPLGCAAVAVALDRVPRARVLVYLGVAFAIANELAVLGYDVYRYRDRDYDALAKTVREVVPPGRCVFLGPSGATPYFALLRRNPMRIAVPVSTPDPEAHRRVAEACGYIAVEGTVTYMPDVDRLLRDETPLVVVDQGPGYRLEIYDVHRSSPHPDRDRGTLK
jgi:4-amino-4-deoxy-L-arabinose transferase-like glycosyltransferase